MLSRTHDVGRGACLVPWLFSLFVDFVNLLLFCLTPNALLLTPLLFFFSFAFFLEYSLLAYTGTYNHPHIYYMLMLYFNHLVGWPFDQLW